MWQKRRLTIEALEPRLVLDSVGIGDPLAGALAFETPSPPYVASTLGVAQVGGQDLFVDVLFEVPAGADANEVALEALAAQGARPFESAGYTFTGLVWDQFLDPDPGNDFVVQNYNPTDDPTGGLGEEALLATHDTWTDVPSSSFAFFYGGETDRWPSLVRESPGPQTFDGYNDVAWMTLRPGVLGVTWWGEEIDEADMALNTRYAWHTDGVNHYDVETVFLHENGHVVGLGHSEVVEAVMYAYYDDVQRTLHQDDIDGLAALYPTEPVEVHDVAVTAVAAPDSVLVGNTAIIDVTVQNQGTFDETFDVVLTESPDGFTDTQAVTLAAGASTLVSFSWHTSTSTTLGDHTLTATAGPVDGETDTADNSLSTTVTVNPVSAVTVTDIDPASMSAGTTIPVTITGSAFVDGAEVTFENGDGPAPTAVVTSVANTTIEATVTAKSGGPPRNRVWDVRVTNLDGSSGVLIGGFTVIPNGSKGSSAASSDALVGEPTSAHAMLRQIAWFHALEHGRTNNEPSKNRDSVAKAVDYLLAYQL